MIRNLMNGLAASATVSIVLTLALSPVIRDAASKTLVATARANPNNRAAVIGERAPDKPRTSTTIEGNSDALVIREAHSDGGYWEWLARQPAE